MNRIPGDIDRLAVAFDEESLVSDAGLLAVGTLMKRLGLEGLLDETVRMGGRVGGSRPGRKILSLVVSMLLGGSHIDHADRLRAGSTRRVLPFRVMASSTLGTFLRSFTWGHVRQLDKALGETLRRFWSAGGDLGGKPVTIDADGTICEVVGKTKHGRCLWVYGEVGVPPAGSGRVGDRRNSPCSHAGRFLTERACAFHRGGGKPNQAGRSHRSGDGPGRFGILVLSPGGGTG